MRKLAFLLSFLVVMAAGNALACQECKDDVQGCATCYESMYDGFNSCTQHDSALGMQMCFPRGWCSDWGGPDPCGFIVVCPNELVRNRVPENRDWQLAAYTFVPAKPVKSLKKS